MRKGIAKYKLVNKELVLFQKINVRVNSGFRQEGIFKTAVEEGRKI